ncbi:uncharacterized protein E6C27_scaffold114G00130 [Cucumis melo var. makuwa]|uniref:Uncharacterized protein n=1 Tax=Cucumis melo var. makuwa TaxID=1194695 RepID=A0A5A7TYS0_CUCMM|nr:uncharacterized protein E6C27_scaffold114G00130 [Cucumis melo var. makuwa]
MVKILHGDTVESYALIPRFFDKLVEFNPSTCTALEMDDFGHFKFCFMTFGHPSSVLLLLLLPTALTVASNPSFSFLVLAKQPLAVWLPGLGRRSFSVCRPQSTVTAVRLFSYKGSCSLRPRKSPTLSLSFSLVPSTVDYLYPQPSAVDRLPTSSGHVCSCLVAAVAPNPLLLRSIVRRVEVEPRTADTIFFHDFRRLRWIRLDADLNKDFSYISGKGNARDRPARGKKDA